MKRFFMHEDGRLKTGRVAFLVFLSVMAGCTLVFYMSQPADKVLLAVKHVFEAGEVTTPEPESAEPEPRPEPAEQHDDKPEPAPPAPDKKADEQPVRAEETRPEAPATSASAAGPSDSETPVPPIPAAHAAPGPETPDQMPTPAVASRPDAKPEPEPAVRPEVMPEPRIEARPAPHADVKPDAEPETKPRPERIVVEIPEPPAPTPLTVGEKAKEPIRFDPIPMASSARKEQQTKQEPEKSAAGEILLASSDYIAVHNSWRKTGEQAAGQASGEGNIPLRIENLKAVFPLFQMKAVALRDGKPYVDLADGTRISEGALEPYSTTCFAVADPLGQWGDALKKAGMGAGGPVEVRYYMYDTVRNAIYARAARAFECCRQKGLIPADLSADAVDLLGRAYAIKRQGGGGFGVFVPVRIDLPDGRSVSVDPSCFAGSADIDHLMASGILK